METTNATTSYMKVNQNRDLQSAARISRAAKRAAKQYGSLTPPMHILNAPTKMMKEIGYGSGYEYDHNTADGFSGQNYFPDGMAREEYYKPVERGLLSADELREGLPLVHSRGEGDARIAAGVDEIAPGRGEPDRGQRIRRVQHGGDGDVPAEVVVERFPVLG